MAIRKLNQEGQISGWHSRMPFPQDNYTLRCLEEDIRPSKGGNPMVTLTWEICHGEPVQYGDKMLDIDGLKITQYLVTKVSDGEGGWDAEKSDKAFSRYSDLLKLLGFPEDGEIDDENPPPFFKGKVISAVVSGQKKTALKQPTPEQKKKGQAGSPIKDAQGKDVVTYQLQIDQVLGLSSVEVNRPF